MHSLQDNKKQRGNQHCTLGFTNLKKVAQQNPELQMTYLPR